jgi:hypothetical protein
MKIVCMRFVFAGGDSRAYDKVCRPSVGRYRSAAIGPALKRQGMGRTSIARSVT